eukprot:CAMPEP_0202444278 /NCGR_PEP_ID=MMETSP1360-20130828/3416_1 /ASSEMBLY_ACC=CAM_ASM_000848 /TAXON_ID=515479 /ORGANISM="Licmophora paradoxa, Strain CCMP2313" /LENGTH=340 /DNA_ID=CAMNT_0049060241 /DNA_START=221 /DNA_END=1243 /DNA_ORIENTATION=-
MPTDTEFVWGAIGTTETCTIVGFMEQSSVAGIMYNGSLSIFYLLRIRYGWSAHKIERLAEQWLHIVPITFGISTMVAGLPLKLYNSGIFDCWIAPYPQGCKQSWQINEDDFHDDGTADFTICERGDNASLYQFAFDLIPKWLSIILATVNMVLIYFKVAEQESKSHSKSFNAVAAATAAAAAANNPEANATEYEEQKRTRKTPSMSTKLAVQSYLFVGAMYITYTPVIITRITEVVKGSVYYEMLLTISIAIPMQGFWNAFVYIRPRWIRERQETNSGCFTAMIHVFQKQTNDFDETNDTQEMSQPQQKEPQQFDENRSEPAGYHEENDALFIDQEMPSH